MAAQVGCLPACHCSTLREKFRCGKLVATGSVSEFGSGSPSSDGFTGTLRTVDCPIDHAVIGAARPLPGVLSVGRDKLFVVIKGASAAGLLSQPTADRGPQRGSVLAITSAAVASNSRNSGSSRRSGRDNSRYLLTVRQINRWTRRGWYRCARHGRCDTWCGWHRSGGHRRCAGTGATGCGGLALHAVNAQTTTAKASGRCKCGLGPRDALITRIAVGYWYMP